MGRAERALEKLGPVARVLLVRAADDGIAVVASSLGSAIRSLVDQGCIGDKHGRAITTLGREVEGLICADRDGVPREVRRMSLRQLARMATDPEADSSERREALDEAKRMVSGGGA
jgi:hypothetical protein